MAVIHIDAERKEAGPTRSGTTVAARAELRTEEISLPLAESGSVDGACGWGYCLAQGEVVEEDPAGAEHYYRQAARAGCEQAMHQLHLSQALQP